MIQKETATGALRRRASADWDDRGSELASKMGAAYGVEEKRMGQGLGQREEEVGTQP